MLDCIKPWNLNEENSLCAKLYPFLNLSFSISNQQNLEVLNFDNCTQKEYMCNLERGRKLGTLFKIDVLTINNFTRNAKNQHFMLLLNFGIRILKVSRQR